MDNEWEFGISELIVMSQLLLIGGLAYVLFSIRQLVMKPPLLIKCDCFKDLAHDDMVKVKELYKTMCEEQHKTNINETAEKEEQEKEVDDLNKED